MWANTYLSAIDNATRSLINMGQLPITCGLFFSLGHSTIVIVITVAIAISSDVYNRIHKVGEVGEIVGAAVSGSFLFIVGLANTVILWRILRQRNRAKQRAERLRRGEFPGEECPIDPTTNSMLMMRILGPFITFVNRPWKMYPVGMLFGFGFDTASSIALLAISAIAKQTSEGNRIPSSHVVILPLLFTAGMTLVDSLDSILMLYSYAGLLENRSRWRVIERAAPSHHQSGTGEHSEEPQTTHVPEERTAGRVETNQANNTPPPSITREEQADNRARVKMNVMSGLSIALTLMSILVAFSISLITIMGLIGANCSRCIASAGAEDGGGLAGAWWRGWANAGEHSGFIGVGIIAAVLFIVVAWYCYRWMTKWIKQSGEGATKNASPVAAETIQREAI